jgi:hypothetical protein
VASPHRGTLWAVLITGPVLSLVAFVLAYFLDPLNFGSGEPPAAVPAALLSVVVLLITNGVASFQQVERAAAGSERVFQAVQTYLHVTKVGTPRKGWEYVMSRLPALELVQNTSFNLAEEEERSSERLYGSDAYKLGPRKIGEATKNGLRWKDIGDGSATDRLREISKAVGAGRNPTNYEFRKIGHREPQLSFCLLTFHDGTREVLFNWDYRAAGQEPTVLLSRDHDIVNMFAVQFDHLWMRASPDHDRSATRSTS